jgi:hypothetical protein
MMAQRAQATHVSVEESHELPGAQYVISQRSPGFAEATHTFSGVHAPIWQYL